MNNNESFFLSKNKNIYNLIDINICNTLIFKKILTFFLLLLITIKENINLSMFFAALASYLSFYSFVIIAPCILFIIENKNDNHQKVFFFLFY